MAITDKDYRLVLYSIFKSSIVGSNVFHFQRGLTGDAIDLQETFEAVILPDIQAVVTEDTIFNRIYCINMDDDADFIDVAINEPGLRTGAPLPYFCTWTFRYFRPTLDVANGRKAFGSIAEVDVADGLPVAGLVTLLNALAITLQTPLSGANGFYQPCIAKTHLIEDPEDPEEEIRVPLTLFPISSVAFTRVSTQNTRKR